VTRQSYICLWNTETWVVEKVKKVGDCGLTCFDVRCETWFKLAILGLGLIEASFDGRFLGYGSSDLTIGLLDAKSLSVFHSTLSYS
jgi:prolactin regulatory element-binding protein